MKFPATKRVISMMATIPYDELLTLVNLERSQVVRTVPLPSTARREGPILMYPKCDVSQKLLEHVGTPVAVETEAEITKLVRMITYLNP